MATPETGWKCIHDVETRSNAADEIVYRVSCYWQNDGYTYAIGNVNAYVRQTNGSETPIVSRQVMTKGNIDSRNVSGVGGRILCGYSDFTFKKTHESQTVYFDALIDNNSTFGTGEKSSAETSVTFGAKTSYTVKYALNGGSGTSTSQTKWYGEDLTLRAAPTRTGYTFAGWKATNGAVYKANDKYTANAATTLTAQWTPNTYPITYYNEASVWKTEYKTQDQTLTLSSGNPTKTNYNFKGWDTSSVATTVRYNPGDTYTGNTALNLYAVWELAYVKPRIEDLSIDREGDNIRISFKWNTDKTITEIKIAWSSVGGGSGTHSVTPVGTTEGFVNELFGNDTIISDSAYTVVITVKDENDSTILTTTLPSNVYGVDAIYDTDTNEIGVALGKAAERTGIVESALPLHVDGNIYSRNDEGVDRGVPVIYDLSEGFNPANVTDSSQDWRCAMALCEVSSTSATTKTYAQGTLVCHNERGTSPPTVIQIAVSDNYWGYTPFITYYGTFADGVKVAPCVFLYNGIKYGGLMFTMSEILLTDVQFTRLNGTFEPFAVMYRDVDKGGIFNSEINSSITTEFEPTEKSIFRSNIVNKCDLLWSGNMTSTTTTISVPYNTSYSGYVLVGAFDDNSSAQKVSVYVPITSIITTQTTWGLGYASEYLDIAIRQNGTYVYVIKKAGSNGAAMITGVYGVS